MVLLQQLLVDLQNAWHDGAGVTDFLPFSDCKQKGEEELDGEVGLGPVQVVHGGLPMHTSLGVEVKVGIVASIPELVKLENKSVQLRDEHFDY